HAAVAKVERLGASLVAVAEHRHGLAGKRRERPGLFFEQFHVNSPGLEDGQREDSSPQYTRFGASLSLMTVREPNQWGPPCGCASASIRAASADCGVPGGPSRYSGWGLDDRCTCWRSIIMTPSFASQRMGDP